MMVELTLHSPVMTSHEVAVYLRLCEPDAEPDEVAKGTRAVHRLVRQNKLRPIQPGKEYAFAHDEVDRYIRDETEAFTTSKSRPSDCQTDGNALS